MSTSTSRSRAPARERVAALEHPGAAIVLWVALGVLVAIRLLASNSWSMAGWGFSLLRFAPPAMAWTLWALSAALLIPPLARPAARALERVGLGPAALLGAALTALVWMLPDRLHFTGDYLLREGTAARALKPAGLFPQALPLDVLLHYRLPRVLFDAFSVPTAITERALGAVEAGFLGLLGVVFARTLQVRGARATAIALVTACGGFLALYTGYGKAIAEMTLFTLAIATFALRALEDPRWLGAVGLVIAAGFVLHRSALALAPAAVLAVVFVLREKPRLLRHPFVTIGLGIGIIVAATMLPRIVSAMRQFDPVHFTPLEGAAAGRVRALWSGTRPLDLANVIGLVSPLGLLVPVLMAGVGWRALGSKTGWILATLALPWLGMTLLIHPPQGMFRDWDNYGAAGICLSMIAAWLIVESVARAPSWSWLTLAAAMAAMGPSLQWLALNADVDRGMARIGAYLSQPPPRSDAERARVWDFLGIRNAQLGRWDASAEAMAKAAETSPSPRVLLQWALAEQARGRSAVARDVFRRVTELAPQDARAWYGLAAESWNLGDYEECRRAALRLEQVNPGSQEARQILDSLEKVGAGDGTPAR